MKRIYILLLILFSINCIAQNAEGRDATKYEQAYRYLRQLPLYSGKAMNVFDQMVAIDKTNFWDYYRYPGQSKVDAITYLKYVNEQGAAEEESFNRFYKTVDNVTDAQALACFSDVYRNTIISKVFHSVTSGAFDTTTQYPNGCNYYLFVFDNSNNIERVIRMGVTCADCR